MQKMLIIVHSMYYDDERRASSAVEWFLGLVTDKKHQFRVECELKGKLRERLIPKNMGTTIGVLEHRIQWHPVSTSLSLV